MARHDRTNALGCGVEFERGDVVQHEDRRFAYDEPVRFGYRHGPAPRSLLPRTAVTGAIEASCSMMRASPMSPAWTMKSLPRNAASASFRRSPCVSEISPTRTSGQVIVQRAGPTSPGGDRFASAVRI